MHVASKYAAKPKSQFNREVQKEKRQIDKNRSYSIQILANLLASKRPQLFNREKVILPSQIIKTISRVNGYNYHF